MPSPLLSTLAGVLAAASLAPLAYGADVLWRDDFEHGLGGWELHGERGIALRSSGDPLHGQVLVLTPHGDDVLALIAGSGAWGSVRLEGELRFPTGGDSYLGVVYDFQTHGGRPDFGVVYIKAPGSYLQANPHRDLNVSRTLYPEYHVPLEGRARITAGKWQRFAVEVVGAVCHLYVGDLGTPQLTFPLFELDAGRLGLQPRSVGSEVWVDHLEVQAIDRLSYQGPPRPRQFAYRPDLLLDSWEVVGPLESTDDALARHPEDFDDRWRPFSTDPRGAVVTSRVVDYHGARTVAYFRTRIRSLSDTTAILHLSTVDDLALWVNGRFRWFVTRGERAWWDFWENPAHGGQRIPLPLVAGDNDLVVRVRGGVYASGGFFARLEPPAAPPTPDDPGHLPP